MVDQLSAVWFDFKLITEHVYSSQPSKLLKHIRLKNTYLGGLQVFSCNTK